MPFEKDPEFSYEFWELTQEFRTDFWRHIKVQWGRPQNNNACGYSSRNNQPLTGSFLGDNRKLAYAAVQLLKACRPPQILLEFVEHWAFLLEPLSWTKHLKLQVQWNDSYVPLLACSWAHLSGFLVCTCIHFWCFPPAAYAVPSADCTEPRVLTPPEDSRQQPLKLPVTGSTAFLMQFDTCGSDMVDVSHGIATFV